MYKFLKIWFMPEEYCTSNLSLNSVSRKCAAYLLPSCVQHLSSVYHFSIKQTSILCLPLHSVKRPHLVETTSLIKTSDFIACCGNHKRKAAASSHILQIFALTRALYVCIISCNGRTNKNCSSE